MASGELALAQRQAALALLEPREGLEASAAAESMLGNVLYGQGDMGAAESHYRASSALYEALQDTPMVAYLLAAIGRTLLSRGQYREAVDSLYGAVTRLPTIKPCRRSWGRHSSLLRWLAETPSPRALTRR